MQYNLTAVIPTRNRPNDLEKAVASVLRQSRKPDELIVVDQSESNLSRARIEGLFQDETKIRLVYIHDQTIAGLVPAKRVAAARSSGELVCFLEDDVVLESDYIEQLERGFVVQPDMVGCSGIVTNMPHQPIAYDFIFHLFHRGIFRDKRVGIFGRFSGRGHPLIPSVMISGGMSAWRREVFSAVPFDTVNGFHLLEDNDFSTRVERHFGPHLYINPNARLEHHWSPVNREILGQYQRRKLVAYITYFKKRIDWPGAKIALPWLLLGLLFEASFKSATARSSDPLKGYFSGLYEGFRKRLLTE